MPQAQVDVQLLSQLNRAMANRDVFSIAAAERAARNLLPKGGDDAGIGYTVLGACAAIRGDAATAKAFHGNALKLIPNVFEAWTNYLVSLTLLWDIEAVKEKIFEFAARFKGHPAMVGKAMATLTEMGLLTTASLFKEKFVTEGEEPESWDDRYSQVLSQRQVSEDDLSRALQVARSALPTQDARGQYTSAVLFDEAGQVGEIVYGFSVTASPAQAAEIERAMFSRLESESLVAEERGAVTFFVRVEASEEQADARQAV